MAEELNVMILETGLEHTVKSIREKAKKVNSIEVTDSFNYLAILITDMLDGLEKVHQISSVRHMEITKLFEKAEAANKEFREATFNKLDGIYDVLSQIQKRLDQHDMKFVTKKEMEIFETKIVDRIDSFDANNTALMSAMNKNISLLLLRPN